MLSAIDKVYFPIPLDEHFNDPYNLSAWSRVNLVPFIFWGNPAAREIIEFIAYNILLTIPFGFGINLLANIKPQKILFLCVAVGIGSELLQLVISFLISYPYRVIDINDMWSNALGVLLGYLIFRLFGYIYIRVTESLKLEHDGLFLYIYETVLRFKNKPLFKTDKSVGLHVVQPAQQ
jgi:glycopeptide antibiotics resistance protein